MNNGTTLQGFSWYLPADGSHWRRIAEQAPDFAYQGITVVWLPPAYALILLREAGYPCVFYGDLYGMPNDGNSPAVGEQDDVVVGEDGWATFRTLGGRLSVYLPERSADALEHDRQPHRIARAIAGDTEEMRA